MELTFEQELLAREFSHKVGIVGAYLIDREVTHQTSGEITIPKEIAEQQAINTVMEKVHGYLADGTFEDMYNIAWEYLKDKMPDNLNATGKTLYGSV